MPVVSFAYRVTSGGIVSGSIGNNAVLSNNIASGQINQFKLVSGTVNSGHLGNNSVVSGSIASGQIGANHIASGVIPSAFNLSSGIITSGYVGNNAITSGNIASGQIAGIHLASGVINNVSGNLTVNSGTIKTNAIIINSSIFSGLTTNTVVYSGSTNVGMAAYFDYALKNTLNSGYRAGTITTIWDNTTQTTEYNETSTPDLIGSTIGISFNTTVLSGNIQLNAIVANGSYNIKIGSRFL